jgi:hypothetical protein
MPTQPLNVTRGSAPGNAPDLSCEVPTAAVAGWGNPPNNDVSAFDHDHNAPNIAALNNTTGKIKGNNATTHLNALPQGFQNLRVLFLKTLMEIVQRHEDMRDAAERGDQRDFAQREQQLLDFVRANVENHPAVKNVLVVEPLIQYGNLVGTRFAVRWNPHSSSSAVKH